MICSKCNREQQDGSYCVYCGNRTNENVMNTPVDTPINTSISIPINIPVDTQNSKEAIKTTKSISGFKLFFVRLFFSVSFINFLVSVLPAITSLLMLLFLPLSLLFGADAKGNIEAFLPYVLYCAGSSIVLFISFSSLMLNRRKNQNIYLCPDCNRTLSNWGYCGNCKKKYNITSDIGTDNQKNTNVSSKIILAILYLLSIANLTFVCVISARGFYIYKEYSLVYIVLFIIYAIISFFIFFGLGDLRVKRK